MKQDSIPIFYREYGRSLKGQLIRSKVSGRSYQRISLVAGLTNGELIAPMTYEETMTSDFFEAWFQKFLLPTLNTPSVIIMDNARFHRMGKLELLCEEFGHKLLLLPPYSPEYHPIKKTWAHIKKHLEKSITKLQYFFRGSFVFFLFQLTISLSHKKETQIQNCIVDWNKMWTNQLGKLN